MTFRINIKNKNSFILSYTNNSKYIVFPKLILIHIFLAQSGSITEKLLFIKGFQQLIGSLPCKYGSSKVEAYMRLYL